VGQSEEVLQISMHFPAGVQAQLAEFPAWQSVDAVQGQLASICATFPAAQTPGPPSLVPVLLLEQPAIVAAVNSAMPAIEGLLMNAITFRICVLLVSAAPAASVVRSRSRTGVKAARMEPSGPPQVKQTRTFDRRFKTDATR
jgi:hypothetical protein